MAPDRLAALEKHRQALDLRIAGATYVQIAERLDYASESGARNAVAQALKKTMALMQDSADELRAIEVQRLDVALIAIALQVKSGHLGAIDRWVKLAERRARLLGLDSPPRAPVDGDGNTVPLAIIRMDPDDL